MKHVLLDTNAYTALLTGDLAVLDTLGGAERVFMSTVVLGELHAGFEGGSKQQRNRELLDDFLRRPPVLILDVTAATAEIFGVVKHRLKKAGSPIPMNDVWIAAHAVETGAWLISFDHHFRAVEGLLLWDGLSD